MAKKDVYELTNPQKSIWYTEQFCGDTTINNICSSVILYEEIDIQLMKKAIYKLVMQNDNFRIKLLQENSIVKQTISDFSDFEIEIENAHDESQMKEIEKKEVNFKFDLFNSNLFKFKIVIFPNKSGGIILTSHHIISDSWSLGLTVKELLNIYNQLKNGCEITEKNNSYVDYINCENEYKKSQKHEIDKKYWEETYKTIPEQATIPTLKKVHKTFSYDAKRVSFTMHKNLVSKINNLCSENKISTFNFIMAIFSIYIGRVSNLDDFVIGTPILNRSNFKDKNTMGMFVNTIPVRINTSNNLEFTNFVHLLSQNMINVLKHQKYSYNSMLDDLRKKYESVPNLYNIIISYQITKAFDEQYGKYKSNWTFNNYCGNDFNIHISDINDTGELIVNYDYLTHKYNLEDVKNMHNRIMHMINQVLDNSKIPTNDIEIVTEKEKNLILNEFNNTNVNYPKNKTIVDLFEEQVIKTPNNIAVVFNDEKLTYRELNEKANSLANYLKNNNIKNEDVVALFLDKSIEMIVAVLGTLKAGAAYLPIDIDYPSSRINYMLEDSNAKIILSLNKINSNNITNNIKILDISLKNDIYNQYSIENLRQNIKNNNLAYIMYTSGSTGKPKGVMVEHKNITRLVKNPNYIKFNHDDKILQTGSIVFDACTFEIWGALLNGLQLYIISKNTLLNPITLKSFINNNSITILWLTAPLFNKLCEDDPTLFNNIKYLLTGGDVLSPKYINIAMENNQNLKIINGYGPTENTTFSCCFNINKKYINSIPIGKPISNSTCYIVSKKGTLQPIGIPGELWVGGDGVSRGYLNKPALNEEKFINNYYSDRVYKTGDLVKWLPDGNIEFLGRIDNQVKIRGFRIELNEINLEILKYQEVKQSYTTICTVNNQKHICSYVVFKNTEKVKDLKDFLRMNLPSYMVPTYILSLDVLPLNINGKVDRTKLPEPIQKIKETIKSRNNIDDFLIDSLEKILKIKNISIEDSFIDLGGDSLTAISLATMIHNKYNISISVKDILENTIALISDYIKNTNTSNNISIPKAPNQNSYPLSSAQKRIYYATKMIDDNNLVYNTPGAILVDTILDVNKTIEIFNQIIKDNSSFRTVFILDELDVRQKILDNVNININVYNNTYNEIDYLIDNFAKPFNLESAPLLRIELHYIDMEKTLLLFDSHHIIMDGTSMKLLLQNFCTLYNAKPLKANKLDYTDYAVWENNYLNSADIQKSENYWLNKFKNNEIPFLNFPYDYNTTNKNYSGDKLIKNISLRNFDKYQQFAKQLNVSPYMLFLSVFFILLYKYTGQEEILVGTPFANRDIFDIKNIIGMFVNNIVVIGKINPQSSFIEFVNSIKNQVIDDITNQPYPFDILIKKLNISNDNYSNPLFDIMFTYQNTPEVNLSLDEKPIKIIPANVNISKFNLSLEIDPNQKTITLEYRTDLFKKETIMNIYEHYINLLENICINYNNKIKNIPMVLDYEKNIIINDFNNTVMDYPINKAITNLFEEQVEKTPNKIALIFQNEKLTYKQLNEKSNQLAHYIKQSGVEPNEIIGIMVNRSLEMIISMLAILKVGCTYLPLDPTYPIDRINYILEDSKVKKLLTQSSLKNNIINNIIDNIIEVDLQENNIYMNYNIDNLNISINPQDIAYLIYTSGSTGNPKGVEITHRNVVNFIEATCQKINFKGTIVSVTTYCFDIFVLESLLPLSKGMTIVLANEQEQNIPQLLNKICINNNVTMLQTTPSRMSLLLSDTSLNYLHNLKVIMLGGEPFPEKLLLELKQHTKAKIYNMYGPTETTVWSSIKDLTNSTEINIGKPIGNTQFYILDANLNLLPFGIIGQLYIGGDGVSKGYFNREDLTQNKFIENPFKSNDIIYNTGDLAKWTKDGEVICMGRSDFQVKIRGLRIELGEIEKRMSKFPNINNAIVCVKKDSINRDFLCGYFTSSERISISELKDYLNKFLPTYMVPTHLIQLSQFKYTPNGKIDRKSLPMPKTHNDTTNIILPETQTEIEVSKLFQKLLSISPISINDNFFEIGGDSILALKLQIELLNKNINISYADIFKYNTIQQLSLCIDSKKTTTSKNSFSIDNYDFTPINNLLKNNTNIEDKLLIKHDLGNVMLTGATGFLGAHILSYLIENTNSMVYCLLRSDPSIDIINKLLKKLNYYFGNKYDNLIGTRIHVIKSDIIDENLGININTEKLLGKNITCVINSAAMVKHYGYYSEFEKINVMGVKNLVKFCIKYNKKLIQISTISVSGNTLFNLKDTKSNFDQDVFFRENNLFINQSLENVYVRSKFEAEKFILEQKLYNNLDALIIRVGNITNRSTDGKFQPNSKENAFANRIKAFMQLKYLPKYLQNIYVEFSPVDNVSEAIIRSIQYADKSISVLHIYNQNHVYINDLIKMIPNNTLSIIDDNQFNNILQKKLSNNDKKENLLFLANDLNEDKKLVYESKIKIRNEFSNNFLKKINFHWSKIDEIYIKKLLDNI